MTSIIIKLHILVTYHIFGNSIYITRIIKLANIA